MLNGRRPLFALLALLSVLAFACGEEAQPTEETEEAEPAAAECEQEPTETESGLVIEEIECGTGAEAVRGTTVVVHYRGTLEKNGKEFDSSYGGDPAMFPLGTGQLIAGWEEGIPGMKVGGKRKLVVPPDLGYGAAGYPPDIPPNATLVFEVELVDVQQ